MGIAWANLLLALMKGFRDAAGNALALILGSSIGVIAYYFCYRLGGYEGALLGLALVPALVVIPAAFMLMRRGNVPLNYLKPQWDKMLAGQLGKFTLMALITSVTLPVAYVMMRNLLAAHYSWDEVGIWQGVSSISDAYLQFITASFSVYLLPTLSRLTSGQDITREIFRSLRFVLPAVAIASFTVWLLRDFAIWLLFSAKFTAMRDLFASATGRRCAESGGIRFRLSGDCEGFAAVVYPGRDRPVCAADGIFSLADPHPRCAGGGSGLYGNLYRLFRCLLRRIFTLA